MSINDIYEKLRLIKPILSNDGINILGVFGSYARGDYNENSDIDIMILTDLTNEEIIEYRELVSNIAFDIEFDTNFEVMISPLVKNIEKFEYWLKALPFYMNVQREGVVLSGTENI